MKRGGMIFQFGAVFMIVASLLGWLTPVISRPINRVEGVSKSQAVNLAEDFIRNNGYTMAPINKGALSYELFDGFDKNIDAALARRHNTLQPKAFCISEDSESWHVGFLSIKIKVEQLSSNQLKSDLAGRAVIVSKDGMGIRIAHKDPAFSYFKKL